MSSYHTKPAPGVPKFLTNLSEVHPRSLVLFLTLAGFVPASAGAMVAQQTGPAPAAMSGAAIRERNRQMDEYDREIDRLRNDAKAPNERRKNLFPQINEDFQKIQVIHNEMVRLVQGVNSMKYDRLIELTAELKKRGNRLRSNLALPSENESDQSLEKSSNNPMPVSDAGVKKSVVTLHDVIVSFVSNPLFKNLGLLDAKSVSRASGDLRDIILLSDNIKKSAMTLGKIARK